MIIKKVKPMFTSLIVTANKYGIDDVPKGSLIDPKKMQGNLKDYQTVVAVGRSVTDIKEGQIVMVDFTRFEEHKKRKGSVKDDMEEYNDEITGYKIPTVEIKGVTHLLIQDRDVSYVIEDASFDDEKESPLIIPSQALIK